MSESDNIAAEMAACLQSIIDGAVHPDIALRCILVDLAPIRAVLAKYRNRPLTPAKE